MLYLNFMILGQIILKLSCLDRQTNGHTDRHAGVIYCCDDDLQM